LRNTAQVALAPLAPGGRDRRASPRLTATSRLVLATTLALLALGTIGFFILERDRTLSHKTLGERLADAWFQSVSFRTAGFNTVDFTQLAPATRLVGIVLMFIGASPGSTGGGIKTTTLAALFSGMRAELGTRAPYMLDRSVPMALIRKAIGVAFLSMSIVFGVVMLMLLLEPHAPLELMFEVVSAFSTTGLSTGITPELSVPGKLVITLTMFVGRIGPLTLALALAASARTEAVELPAERVMIG
jgi:trk system potassium uptake protein TrkH